MIEESTFEFEQRTGKKPFEYANLRGGYSHNTTQQKVYKCERCCEYNPKEHFIKSNCWSTK